MTLSFLLFAGALAATAKPRPLPAVPGRWEITTTFAMGGLPFAPPPRTVERCVSGRGDPRALLADIGPPEDDCTLGGYVVDGKEVRWTAACAGRYRGAASGVLTFDGDRGTGDFTIEIEDGRGARHPVRYRIEGARRGPCSP